MPGRGTGRPSLVIVWTVSWRLKTRYVISTIGSHEYTVDSFILRNEFMHSLTSKKYIKLKILGEKKPARCKKDEIFIKFFIQPQPNLFPPTLFNGIHYFRWYGSQHKIVILQLEEALIFNSRRARR